MHAIGKRIRDRRNELGFTQQDLADKMGYKSKATINKIEMGINDVAQSKIPRYAKALDTTLAYLMGWDEPQYVKEEVVCYVERPELKALLEAAQNLSKEDIEKVIKIIEMFE